MMKIVAVVGFSESGKTRLVVRLIRELKRRGLRVSALKRCSHDFSLDTDGKDTAAFSQRLLHTLFVKSRILASGSELMRRCLNDNFIFLRC